MELFLQFGHGMMEHSKHLIGKWGGGTVILSPRDLELPQMIKLSGELQKISGNVMLDPQFYLPHADHERLTAHSFWPQDYSTAGFDKSLIRKMLSSLKTEYTDVLNPSVILLPGLKSGEIDDDWFKYHSNIYEVALEIFRGKKIYHTLCLSRETLKSEEQLYALQEYLEAWQEVSGFYLVPEPPENQYLIEDPNWLINLIDLAAGIKQQSKKLIIGYCSHQMLYLGLAKVDAIASGTWLNVRRFDADKFQLAEDSQSRRSTWYYCPQTLSEYQIPFLDVAKRVGRLDQLATDSSFDSHYADVLFAGATPSAVNFTEREAFRHYLQCLKVQAKFSPRSTYQDTRASLKMQLETANQLIQDLKGSGIRSGDRDFSNVIDYNLSAIDAFHQVRGLLQSQIWQNIS